jgi:serine/threonine-protein phosphatase 2A regulatory subunit B'
MLSAAGPTNPLDAAAASSAQATVVQPKKTMGAGTAYSNSTTPMGNNNNGKTTLLNVPSLKATPPAERPAMFQNHLILTQQVFNFNDPTANVEEKEAKRALLLGLVEHINSSKDVFTDNVFPDVIAMLSANLFRDLPSREGEGEGEDDEPVLEAAWPHLQIVYEFLLRFVVSADVDAKVAKKHISQPFISQLLELFNSEDPREREYLKTILHRIYGKYMGLRAFIRRAINYVFFRVMYESERHNGIGELLEILGSIINGFALPLKAEHKRFLVRALIPLHKVKSVATFHNQLAYCVTQFVEKDPKMIEPIVLGILRFWPHSSSPKQVLFLNELEDLLELTQPGEFAKIAIPLFERINTCVDSPHFQVAERALFLWNNEYIVSLIAQNRHLVLPLVISSLSKNAAEHWNATVTSLTGNVLKLFVEMDKNFFKDCRDATLAREKEQEDAKQKRLKHWELVEKEAKAAQVL